MNKALLFTIIGALVLFGPSLFGQGENIYSIMRPDLITFLNDPRRPRGIRNNNPGNIRRSNSSWQGRVAWSESRDKNFEQFTQYFWGVRALIVLLTNYITIHKTKNIEQLISRWAPPTENDTESYIQSVVTLTGIKRNATLSTDKETLRKLCYAIADHENGVRDPIPDPVFDYAWTKV